VQSTRDACLTRASSGICRLLEAQLAQLRVCAGCHDQCLFGTVEVFARGTQSLATSRKALLMLQIAQGTMTWTPSAIDVVYSALDSRIQHAMCVHRGREGGWPDETEYVRAARHELVQRELEPIWVRRIRATARKTGNPYGAPEDKMRPGVMVLLADAATRQWDRSWRSNWASIGRLLGLDVGWIGQGSSGFELLDLGYIEDARSAAVELRDAIAAVKADQMICDAPEAVWMIEHVWPSWGLGLEIPVRHSSVWLAERNESLRRPSDGQVVAYHDAAVLARDLAVIDQPRAVLEALGVTLIEFVRRGNEVLPAGSYHGVAQGSWLTQLAADRTASAVALGADAIVAGSPFDLGSLTGHGLPVFGFLRLVADRLASAAA
jgi:hypothetical protein